MPVFGFHKQNLFKTAPRSEERASIEVFYNQVASGVLDKAEKSLENANKKHTGALNNSIQALNEATNRLNLKFIIIFASTFVAVMMVFILAIKQG